VQYVSEENQTLNPPRPMLALTEEVGPSSLPVVVLAQVHWQSTMAGKPVTDMATSVYACKSASNPQWQVNVLTLVLWLPYGVSQLYHGYQQVMANSTQQ